jgi:hypothetical protein
MTTDECKQHLVEGAQKLDPVLNQLGFVFEISGSGGSSPGPFATGFYVNGDKRIGLIYRSIAGLGSVNYEDRQSSVSHSNLMHYLGKQEVSKLKYDTNKLLSYSKDGGNAFDALVYDIQYFGAEILAYSDEQFGSTLKEIAKTPNTITERQATPLRVWIMIGLIIF